MQTTALDVIGPAAGMVVATGFPGAASDQPADAPIEPERVAAAAATQAGVRVTIEARAQVVEAGPGPPPERDHGRGSEMSWAAASRWNEPLTTIGRAGSLAASARAMARAGSATAVQCPAPDRVLIADHAQDVSDVLDRVPQATDIGRWAYGYVAYEAAAGLDPQLPVHDHRHGAMPLVWFGICDEPVPVPPVAHADAGGPYRASWTPGWTRDGHAEQVRRIRRHIAAGDSFQCNLTVRLDGRVDGDLRSLYRDLALRQRGAHTRTWTWATT